MKRFATYLKPYWLPLLVMVALIVGQTMANLALPDLMARIVNEGIVGGDSGAIWEIGLRMLLVALAGGACMVGVGFIASRVATGVTRTLRQDLFQHVEEFSLLEFGTFSTASLITRCTNDIQQIQMVLVLVLRLALMAPFMGIGAVIKAEQLAPSMTWIMAVAIGILFIAIVALFVTTIPRFTRLQGLVDRLNLVTRESLTGIRVVRAFNRQSTEGARFDEANRDLTDANLVVNRLTAVMQPLMLLVLNLTMVAVVWVGAHRIDAGTIQIGDMLAFMQYAMQAIFAFLMMSMIFIMLPRATVSARRVGEILDTEPSITDPANPAPFPRRGGMVEFRDVSFAYPGAEEPVLRGITFTARPGEVTAFVGSTGSGKTTVVSLVPRFYDVTGGQVLVDGVDVRDVRQADLRARIGYVSQRAVLFSGTVASTIEYGAPGISDEEIGAAVATAQASEFIDQLDLGFRSSIAQGGSNVSGGQKQRLAIARALARNPEIYIFDDSFSALDFRTDARLRAALAEQTRDRTVLIVAQRISTILQADNIVVLDQGQIVGQGTHAELVQACEVYRQIASSQLSERELQEIVAGSRDGWPKVVPVGEQVNP